MTRMEILYLVWRDEGEQQARESLRLLDSLAIEWIACEPQILETSAYVKSHGGLSVADSWIAATAISVTQPSSTKTLNFKNSKNYLKNS